MSESSEPQFGRKRQPSGARLVIPPSGGKPTPPPVPSTPAGGSRPDWRVDFPATYDVLPVDDRVVRPQVFDPPMKHHHRGFRLGEPIFADPSLSGPWLAARRRVVDHVLRAIAGTPWAEHLVLRGSLLLKAWLGEAAREPGDVDWVVLPPPHKTTSPTAVNLLADVTAAVLDRRPPDGIELLADRVRTSAIWTYERAEGRRVVFPWRSADLPAGVVQLDFVFQEPLPISPVLAEVPASDGGPSHVVLAASPGLSLAWKLLWLETDWHPQGKDLYDATLLAERTTLAVDVLLELLATATRPNGNAGGLRLRMFSRPATVDSRRHDCWKVDWDNFTREYPSVSGTAGDWLERLRCLLPAALSD